MSCRVALRMRKPLAAARRGWLVGSWAAVALVLFAGCGGQSKVPVGDAAENIRKLALGYVQYAAQSGGVGPKDQKTLTDFIVQRNGLPQEEVEKSYVSIRDNQPYVIRWGLRPQGSGPLGAEPPKPVIIIFERTGAEGIRFVADSRPEVLQMTDEELKQHIPDLESLIK